MRIHKDKNLILIGYMGCGKSTIGKKAAKALNFQFLDTDAKIEQEEGKSISQIFQQKGEAYFRQKETELLLRLLKEPKGYVIATGGGLPMQEGNAELLKKLGSVVYLKVQTDTLVRRLSSDTTRPLLQNRNLKETIETMLEVRNPVYEATANLIIQTDGMSFYEIICKIEQLMSKRRKKKTKNKEEAGSLFSR